MHKRMARAHTARHGTTWKATPHHATPRYAMPHHATLRYGFAPQVTIGDQADRTIEGPLEADCTHASSRTRTHAPTHPPTHPPMLTPGNLAVECCCAEARARSTQCVL